MRTDIVLVVDGKIVDLNRIRLPKDAVIPTGRWTQDETCTSTSLYNQNPRVFH